MTEHKKKKKFLELPRYIGDRQSFREFVRLNMRYPKDALALRIEGVVHVWYMVNDQGKVTQVEVEKGLGHGCDEEAVRLVRLMRFSKVKNRGMRVSSRNKARIEFKLPKEQKISYQVKPKSSPETPAASPQPSKPGTYSYSITIKPAKPEGEA